MPNVRRYTIGGCQLLADALFPEYSIDIVKYFTARIAADPRNADERVRQAAYLDALSVLPRLECTEGYYRERIKHRWAAA